MVHPGDSDHYRKLEEQAKRLADELSNAVNAVAENRAKAEKQKKPPSGKLLVTACKLWADACDAKENQATFALELRQKDSAFQFPQLAESFKSDYLGLIATHKQLSRLTQPEVEKLLGTSNTFLSAVQEVIALGAPDLVPEVRREAEAGQYSTRGFDKHAARHDTPSQEDRSLPRTVASNKTGGADAPEIATLLEELRGDLPDGLRADKLYKLRQLAQQHGLSSEAIHPLLPLLTHRSTSVRAAVVLVLCDAITRGFAGDEALWISLLHAWLAIRETGDGPLEGALEAYFRSNTSALRFLLHDIPGKTLPDHVAAGMLNLLRTETDHNRDRYSVAELRGMADIAKKYRHTNPHSARAIYFRIHDKDLPESTGREPGLDIDHGVTPRPRATGAEATSQDAPIEARASRSESAPTKTAIDALILKGGGVKGLAFAGAIAELERHYTFNVFVGTSAGAIAAALLAAGFSGPELGVELRRKDFRSFLDGRRWRYPFDVLVYQGLHTGVRIQDWLRTLLHRKLQRGGDDTLEDLQRHTGKRLVIYAAHSDGRAVTFDSETTNHDYTVHTAVRCSMSIPIFFQPQKGFDSKRVFDGGMLHNFPVEIFLEQESTRGHAPGFIALYLGSTEPVPLERRGLLFDLANTWMGQDERGVINRHPDDIIVIDPDPISTVDFSLSEDEKSLLVTRGRVAAMRFLRRRAEIAQKPSEEALVALEAEEAALTQSVERRRRWRRVWRWLVRVVVLAALLLTLYAVVASMTYEARVGKTPRGMIPPSAGTTTSAAPTQTPTPLASLHTSENLEHSLRALKAAEIINDPKVRYCDRCVAMAKCIEADLFRGRTALERVAELLSQAPESLQEQGASFPQLVKAVAPLVAKDLEYVCEQTAFSRSRLKSEQAASGPRAAIGFWYKGCQGALQQDSTITLDAVERVGHDGSHFADLLDLCGNPSGSILAQMHVHNGRCVRALALLITMVREPHDADAVHRLVTLLGSDESRDGMALSEAILRKAPSSGSPEVELAERCLAFLQKDATEVERGLRTGPAVDMRSVERSRADRFHAAEDYVVWSCEFASVAQRLESPLVDTVGRYTSTLASLKVDTVAWGNGDLLARASARALISSNRAMYAINTPLVKRVTPRVFEVLERLFSMDEGLLDRLNLKHLRRAWLAARAGQDY